MGDPKYVFIDESGDLGKQGCRYFIIVALITNKPKPIYQIIKRIRRRRLKKTMLEQPEIKANSSDNYIRNLVLRKVSEAECNIIVLVVRKEKIFDRLMAAQNKLYNYLCGILLKNITSKDEVVSIIIDRKYNNRLLSKDFDNYIRHDLEYRHINAVVEQTMSHNNNGLQVVDFVAWAIYRKYNVGDSQYYEIIEGKITNKSNMFWP